MKTYVKKPVKIEAVQLTRNNAEEVKAWANNIQPADKQIYHELDAGMQWQGLAIPTKEGVMICGIGDYLIKEPFPTDNRMFYPCKQDIFCLTYDEFTEHKITVTYEACGNGWTLAHDNYSKYYSRFDDARKGKIPFEEVYGVDQCIEHIAEYLGRNQYGSDTETLTIVKKVVISEVISYTPLPPIPNKIYKGKVIRIDNEDQQ